MKFSAPRGTHDVLPSEQPFWSLITRTAEEVCELYGYGRLVTPGFEDTGLFERTSGQGSDIVRKEMYTFEDRGGRSLTLRPEGTAPTARAYVEHGLDREPQPFKAYSIAPMYRYDRPQKGRYREHWQFNVEAIGSSDPAIDAEIIQLYTEFLRRLGVRRYGLELNSIGDRNCRSVYLERLEAWLDEHDDALDADARAKRETSPLRVFDTKNPAVEAALADAPKIGESLCAECGEQFAVVRAHLDAYGVSYELRPALVRGLDYYTRTTFEFIGEALGAKDVICGGGRYDYLVEEIGGPPTPGIGFGAGIERLRLQIEEEGAQELEEPGTDVFFAFEEGAARERVSALMAELRREGRRCDTDYAGRSLRGQLTQAGRLGARTTVIVGPAGATVRRAGDEDVAVALDDLKEALAG
ncbi:MAG TPA: histidine--tRNA ligase [Gaiellaceae bacterium]